MGIWPGSQCSPKELLVEESKLSPLLSPPPCSFPLLSFFFLCSKNIEVRVHPPVCSLSNCKVGEVRQIRSYVCWFQSWPVTPAPLIPFNISPVHTESSAWKLQCGEHGSSRLHLLINHGSKARWNSAMMWYIWRWSSFYKHNMMLINERAHQGCSAHV